MSRLFSIKTVTFVSIAATKKTQYYEQIQGHIFTQAGSIAKSTR